MKKTQYLLSILAIITIMLAGCGDKSAEGNKASGKSKQADGFKEQETFELDGPVNMTTFSFDEEGTTLFWGETNGGMGDDARRYVWLDGDVKELDMEKYDQFAMLSPSGTIINSQSDHDKDENSILEYDPSTDEEESFVISDSDHNEYPLPGYGTYIQDPRTYVHTETNTKFDDSETFLWDIDNDEYTDMTFIQDIKKDVGKDELTSYPHFFLSEDASTVYATVSDDGIFAYDMEKGETENLLSTDNIMPVDTYTTTLTSDEAHIAYAVNESEDDEFSIVFNALDLDSEETIEIGEGNALFTLSDGNIIIIDKNDDEQDVKYFDFETEELETIHTIKEEENQEIDNITVSLDGSTIAYGYTEYDEDNDDSTWYMTILSNQ